MTVKKTLLKLRKTLESWGLSYDDWFLILHYCDIVQGYNMKYSRDEHLHIMIRFNKVPWKIKKEDADKEIYFPQPSRYQTSFFRFIKETGYDFHIFAGDQNTFKTIKKKYFIFYKIGKEGIPMATTLGNLFFWKLHIQEYIRTYSPEIMRRRFLWIDQMHELAKKKGDKKVANITGWLISKYRPKDTIISVNAQKAMQYYKKYKVIKGAVGFKGFVRGRVFLVRNPDRPQRLIKGKILISKLTSPKLIPYIQSSKAVITDEGGKLSHASIYCQEYQIPCIIGTKIATKVLKNGDLVEVDAERGIVKKL